MSLDEYRRKRRPGRTPEPAGGEAEPADGDRPLFVVQRHDARRLHYDLRLEMNGVLASWALPKGLPLEVGERYLAVHTEDHPMQYAPFSGVFPKGQYGAGVAATSGSSASATAASRYGWPESGCRGCGRWCRPTWAGTRRTGW